MSQSVFGSPTLRLLAVLLAAVAVPACGRGGGTTAVPPLPIMLTEDFIESIYPAGSDADGFAGYKPEFLSDNLTSNRFNALPNDRFQISVYYDGEANSFPTLEIECFNMNSDEIKSIVLENLSYSSHNQPVGKINTAEYDLNGFYPTGQVTVSGIVPNGVIDGIAFGLFWKDAAGKYHLYQSRNPVAAHGARFVGMWPVFLSDTQYALQTTYVTDYNARGQSRASLLGAEYLENGTYNLAILENSVIPWAPYPVSATRPTRVTPHLSTNRFDALKSGRVQISLYYDGEVDSFSSIAFECLDPQSNTASNIVIENISHSSHNSSTGQITTAEYDLNGMSLTGKVTITGVTPNGVIDGLAFGLFWKDTYGKYHVHQSRNAVPVSGANFVGMWPTFLSDTQYGVQTPQLTDYNAAGQSRSALLGAQYLSSGEYYFDFD